MIKGVGTGVLGHRPVIVLPFHLVLTCMVELWYRKRVEMIEKTNWYLEMDAKEMKAGDEGLLPECWEWVELGERNVWRFLRRGKESWQEGSFPFSRFPRWGLCPQLECLPSPSRFCCSRCAGHLLTFHLDTALFSKFHFLTGDRTSTVCVLSRGSSSALPPSCPSDGTWCSRDSQSEVLNSAGVGSFHSHLVFLNQKPVSSVKTSTVSWWLLHNENLAQCLEQSRLNIFHLVFVEPAPCFHSAIFSPSLVDPLWSSVIVYSLLPPFSSLLSSPPPSLLFPFLSKVPPEGKFTAYLFLTLCLYFCHIAILVCSPALLWNVLESHHVGEIHLNSPCPQPS